MARFRKGEFIAKTRIMGYPTKEIAEMIYRDGSEKGQRRVRAMLSYMMKKKTLLNDSESCSTQQPTEQSSLVDIVSKLRKRKNFSAVKLWSTGYSVRKIALLLYGDDSEQSQNRVYAHISKFRKRMRRRRSFGFRAQNLRSKDHGCDFPEQNLRSGVGGCEFPEQNHNFWEPNPNPQPRLERTRSFRNGGGEAIPTV